jgi:hypothetical protein
MGVTPKQKISFLIRLSVALGSGFWLYLYFLRGKNKGYRRNPLRELHVDGRTFYED